MNMSKHHQKQENDLQLLTPLPDNSYELVKGIINEQDWQEWAISELMNSGPRHKQVYSALLLGRMHVLLQAIEKIGKSSFTLQAGEETTSLKEEVTVPVPLPYTVADKDKFDAISEITSHSPSHEIIAFNTLLQSIEWSITTLFPKALQD